MQSQVRITDSVFDAGPKEFVFGRFDGSNEPSGMEKKLYEKKKKQVMGGAAANGDAGHRSPHLSHVTQALYHLSYTV